MDAPVLVQTYEVVLCDYGTPNKQLVIRRGISKEEAVALYQRVTPTLNRDIHWCRVSHLQTR